MELYLIKIRDTPLPSPAVKQIVKKENILDVAFPIYIYVIKQKWLGESYKC